VSRHLSVLENAGLATSRRAGQRVLYGLVRDTLMEALSGFAAELAPNPAPSRHGRASRARRSSRHSNCSTWARCGHPIAHRVHALCQGDGQGAGRPGAFVAACA